MKKRIDISGQRFGRLTAINFAYKGRDGHAVWRCICDCGNESFVSVNSLRSGGTKSCGCYNLEAATKRIVAYNTKHGDSHSRLFRIWQLMKARCYNKKAINYCDYGARGITVCDEWIHDYSAFMTWAHENGYAENLTIDRINNNLGYSPDNCRWVTTKQQNNNRRSNCLVEFNGETHTISEWADIKGIRYDVLLARLRSGRYTVERALTEPQHQRGKYPRRKNKEVAQCADAG